MKCRVTAIGGREVELSYRVKCVAVESERVFGDVIVTHDKGIADLLPIHWSKRQNLVRQYLDGPNLLELNRRVDHGTRRQSISTLRPSQNQGRCNETSRFGRSKSFEYSASGLGNAEDDCLQETWNDRDNERKRKIYPLPSSQITVKQEMMVSSLVNQLLVDIYGSTSGGRSRSESESTNSSWRSRRNHKPHLQRTRLELKCTSELRILLGSLREHISHTGGLLIRQLRRRDCLQTKRDKLYDVITAHLQAHSSKRSEDTRIKFSLTPQPGKSGFIQWLDAMKMVAKLQGGIPAEFRKKLWLTLAERHLEQRGVDWKQAEKLCFNEWSNPDDEELGIQIVKDLHRTGCSLFCGAAGRDNQAVLRRVLLGFARWNKSVGYCQGLNVLAALILQVVDRDEAAAVKVMIHLIEGVLPEGYFADSLKGLSVDMAVFRDLLRMRLPKLSRHLESLQNDAKDKSTGNSYEPPLTNVFTMQWFLTLFCHCLPQNTVLRVWDLIFLEGDDVLLRTALAIWEGLSDRIMAVTSADEFYSIMGVLTREMLEFTDTNHLVKTIVSMGTLLGITNLREKHRYNITPWARRLSDDDDSDTEDDERLAVAAAAAMFVMPRNKKSDRNSLQTVTASNDRERLALDISTLKQQYAKLRERQRQAHIILSAACARQSMVPTSSATQAMNHLLVGKSALVSNKNRPIGPPSDSLVARAKAAAIHSSPRSQSRRERQQQNITIHWKDMKKHKDEREIDDPTGTSASDAGTPNFLGGARPGLAMTSVGTGSGGTALDSDSDSTSTELCDEPDRLSDVDSEELTSTSDCYVTTKKVADEERLSTFESCGDSISNQETVSGARTSDHLEISTKETSIAEITDQIRRLSADDADFKTCLEDAQTIEDNKLATLELNTVDHFTEAKKSFNTDYFIEEKKSTDLLYNETFFAEKKSTIPESFDTDYSIESKKSMILPLLDDAHLLEEKISRISKPFDSGNSIEEKKSTITAFDNVYSFDEKNSTISELSDKGRKIEEKELSSSTVCEIDHLIPEKKSFEFSSSLNDKSAYKGLNINTKEINHITPIAEISNYRCDFLEPESKVDISQTRYANKSATIGNISNKAIETVSINVADVAADTYELNSAEVEYSTRSSYVIGHMPIAPKNFEIKKNVKSVSKGVIISKEMADNIRDRIEQQTYVNSLVTSDLSFNTKLSMYKMQLGSRCSPNTPESINSFDSGETMGPDSIASSVIISPKTPSYYESRDLSFIDKSIPSSISAESKTLTMGSIDFEAPRKNVEVTGEQSVTPSTDSLIQVKSMDAPCSSSDSLCSSTKLKFSERSISSELQSPISANSIKYTANYNYKCDGEDLQKPPSEMGSVTSPFYPILNPNKNTLSPYGEGKNAIKKDVIELNELKDIAENQDTKSYLETRIENQAFNISEVKNSKEKMNTNISPEINCFKNNFKQDSYTKFENYSLIVKDDFVLEKKDYNSAFETYHKSKFEDEIQEMDTLSPLPGIQFDYCSNVFERTRGCSLDGKIQTLQISGKSCERSSSSLEKRFPDMLLSPSMEDFANNIKKRSSDVLEDLRHLEAKTIKDGEIDPNMLTRKTSFIWEDLKSLEARRQDTFSDSASNFSKQKIDVPGISVSLEGRKTYIVEPKININSSDSILKTVTYKSSIENDNDDGDEQVESKLGVWTKVKPRKRSDSGRRSSDRALKIIQENSAILQKILTCQARKRLPDLEEISKEITISPINEEISKIFSPILEKMGLNENEINEELAKINFKDLDRNTATTTASEFDAKINDELSKLSLIGDNDEVAYLPDVADISSDYLVARDAFIDQQINEELSKLLANYEGDSPLTFKNGSSSLNASEDLSNSTNVHSYQSSNDSLNIKIDHNSKEPMNSLIYPDNPLSYGANNEYLSSRNLLMKSDINVYNQFGNFDQISGTKNLSTINSEICHQDVVSSTISYISDIVQSPKIDYSTLVIENKQNYNISSLQSPYNSTYNSSMLQASPYDYKSRISPRKTPSNPYSVRSYDPKNTIDTGFENSTFELTSSKTIIPTALNYEYGSKKTILSKENLEFQVKYNHDEETIKNLKSAPRNIDLKLSPFETGIAELSNNAPYYSNNQIITPTINYKSNKDTGLFLSSNLQTKNYESAYQIQKYENAPQTDKYYLYRENYMFKQPYESATIETDSQASSYLTDVSITTINRHQDIQSLPPHYYYSDYEKVMNTSCATVSPEFNNSLTTITSTETTITTKTTTVIPKSMHAHTLADKSYKKSKLSLGIFEENKQIIKNATTYGFDDSSSSKSLGFSPFPS